MNPKSYIDTATLSTVTVTFNPDVALLEAQLRALPDACAKIIVDNASQPSVIDEVQLLADRTPNARVLRNDSNLGLAAAINRGVQMVSGLEPAPEFVLLLDQDSEPRPGSIETLLATFLILEKEGRKVGCVGPLLLDPQTSLTHGFHQCTRWRWKRIYPDPGSMQPIKCANLNGSGTLMRRPLFATLGGLDESLFIDHVDTEWAFRVQNIGYGLWGVPSAVFLHRMGEASIRYWLFGWRVWPSRSPQRHYYLFRNAAILMGRPYVPCIWKVWAVVKLLITASIMLGTSSSRSQHISSMWRGVKHGRYGNF